MTLDQLPPIGDQGTPPAQAGALPPDYVIPKGMELAAAAPPTRAWGFDCSVWTSSAALDAALAQRPTFAIMRLTYGTSRDSMALEYCRRIKAAGVVLGGFGFGVNGADPAAQADAMTAVAAAVGPAFLALDFEAEANRPPMTPDQGRAFVARSRRSRSTGLYASAWAYPNLGQDWDWVANWGHVPAGAWTFWQYTGSGLDRDYFNGDVAAFAAWLRRTQGATTAETSGAGMPPGVAGGFNLFPITAHRAIALPADTVLYRPNGAIHTKLRAPIVLGLILATGTHYLVADGDAAVFVKRVAAGDISTADINAGT